MAGLPLDESDLEAVDQHLANTLRTLRRPALSEAELEDALGGEATFTLVTAEGRVAELEAGGCSRRVTQHSRLEYAALLARYRLRECDRQLAAMRRGLATVAPLGLLQLFTWRQVEDMVAGQPEVDLDDLRRHTEYRGYAASSPVVGHFWRVMEGLSQNERGQFIRFVWGRSRLPLKGRPWPQNLRIERCAGGDDRLPVTHTCFFSIELPEYSSEAICQRRLVTAINYGVGGILNG